MCSSDLHQRADGRQVGLREGLVALADLGADVVKVERPGTGDDTRTWGPPFVAAKDGGDVSAAYFHACNRGKRSIAVDLSRSEGAELVRKGGRIVVVGYAMNIPFSIHSPDLALGEVEIVGSRYCSRDDLGRAIELVRSGQIRTVVDAVRPLEEVNEAYDDLIAGRIVGRVVLDLGK